MCISISTVLNIYPLPHLFQNETLSQVWTFFYSVDFRIHSTWYQLASFNKLQLGTYLAFLFLLEFQLILVLNNLERIPVLSKPNIGTCATIRTLSARLGRLENFVMANGEKKNGTRKTADPRLVKVCLEDSIEAFEQREAFLRAQKAKLANGSPEHDAVCKKFARNNRNLFRARKRLEALVAGPKATENLEDYL